MPDIDLETITPSAPDPTDKKVVRRGADPGPYSVALVPDGATTGLLTLYNSAAGLSASGDLRTIPLTSAAANASEPIPINDDTFASFAPILHFEAGLFPTIPVAVSASFAVTTPASPVQIRTTWQQRRGAAAIWTSSAVTSGVIATATTVALPVQALPAAWESGDILRLVIEHNTLGFASSYSVSDLDAGLTVSLAAISAIEADVSAVASDVSALETEIADARGDRSALGLRISTISNFVSPNAGGVIVGQFYDNAFHGTASSTLAGAAGRVDMAPFYTSVPLRIDQIGVSVSTAVAAALGRCFIYEAGADGWPDALLYEAGDDLDFALTGYKFHALDFTFDSGRQYWLGCRFSATGTIRAISVNSAVNLGVNGSGGANYYTALRRTLAFATPLPASWNFVAGDRVANVGPPSIRMRAAAI